MMFFSPAKITIECMEQNLDITNLDLTNTIQNANVKYTSI